MNGYNELEDDIPKGCNGCATFFFRALIGLAIIALIVIVYFIKKG